MSEQPITAFLSCSLRESDKAFVSEIEKISCSHGFSVKGTVGKYTQSPSNLLKHIEHEIKNHDCVIMAATPRYIQEDVHTGEKKISISEILIFEYSIAIDNNKPVLIFVQQGTDVPTFFKQYTEYLTLPPNYERDDELKQRISSYFDSARDIIRNTTQEQNFKVTTVKPKKFLRGLPLIGRVTELQRIKTELENGNSICLTGMGGIGKTVLVYKVIDQVEQLYENIIQVQLDQKCNVADFALHFFPLFTNAYEERIWKDLYKITKKLSTYNRNLIVVDNFELLLQSRSDEDRNNIKSFLKALPDNTQLLLLSREEVNIDRIKSIRLAGLNREEAITLFQDNASRLPSTVSERLQNQLMEVVELVKGHPLAIKIMAKCYSRGMFDIHKIRESNVLGLVYENVSDDRFVTLLKCFDYSYKMINRRLRRSLLELEAFEFPFTEDAAKEILQIHRKDLIRIFETGFLEKIDISERGLPSDNLFFDFHPLIRMFINKKRRGVDSKKRNIAKYYTKLIDRAIDNDQLARDVFNSIIITFYLLNDLKMLITIIDYQEDLASKSMTSNKIGLLLIQLGFYEISRIFHQKCLEIDTMLQDNRRMTNDLRNIGLSYQRSNKQLALKYCIDALARSEDFHIVDPMQYLEVGNILISMNRNNEAFKYCHKGYFLASKKKDLFFVYCINGISICHYFNGKILKAFGFISMAHIYLKSLENTISKQQYEECEAILLSNLAMIYRKLGKVRLSISNLLIATEIDKKYHNVHGLLKDYYNLKLYYYDLGDIKQGNIFYEKCGKLKGDLTHGIPIDSSDGRLMTVY